MPLGDYRGIQVADAHAQTDARQYQVHQSLKSGDCVSQSEQHRSVAKHFPSRDESSLVRRIRVQLHLVE